MIRKGVFCLGWHFFATQKNVGAYVQRFSKFRQSFQRWRSFPTLKSRNVRLVCVDGLGKRCLAQPPGVAKLSQALTKEAFQF